MIMIGFRRGKCDHVSIVLRFICTMIVRSGSDVSRTMLGFVKSVRRRMLFSILNSFKGSGLDLCSE